MNIIEQIGGLLWGPYTFFMLMGMGILFTLWTKFVQYKAVTHGISVVKGDYDNPDDPGAISHFQALSAALSATVGLGNIGGVALAISTGGPGSIFWMWVIGFLGMAVKSVEVTLALMYRNTDDPENPSGGAMWVIDKTLGSQGGGKAVLAKFLGGFFCCALLVSSMTGGNMFQAWNVADLFNVYFGVPQVATGIGLAVLVGAVIVGGIKRIGDVAGKIVPLMCALYLLASLTVLGMNITEIPAMFALIVKSAFTPVAAGGAFVGIGAYAAFEIGLKRALFSNEAGQGSAPIAHSAVKTDEPASEGVVSGLEPLIDTILICTLTGLVILSTGAWNRPPVGALKGEMELVQSEQSTTLIAPTSAEALPKLKTGDVWQPGSQIFVLIDVPQADGSLQRQRVFGTLLAGENSTLDKIEWEKSIPKGAIWSKDESGQPEKRIFRKFSGASLTGLAFDRAVPGLGKWLVSIAALMFAVSTMISWSYYGEQGFVYLFSGKGIMVYKMVFLAGTLVAPLLLSTDRELGMLADLGTGIMLWGNLPILLSMGYLAVAELSRYFKKVESGEIAKTKGI